MKAILLQNDILIAEAWDVKWPQKELEAYITGVSAAGNGEGFSFCCDNHFVKNFVKEEPILNCILIFESLQHKYLYGLRPISIVRDEKYSKIEFIMNYFLSEENISEDFKNKWVSHIRNQRIEQILSSKTKDGAA